MDEIGFLRVTNRTGERFTARFHGEDFEFGEDPVDLSVEAAAHIFGFGAEDKTRALHRLGWLTATQQMPAALAKLRKIEFEPVQQIFEISRRRTESASHSSPATVDAEADEGAQAPSSPRAKRLSRVE